MKFLDKRAKKKPITLFRLLEERLPQNALVITRVTNYTPIPFDAKKDLDFIIGTKPISEIDKENGGVRRVVGGLSSKNPLTVIFFDEVYRKILEDICLEYENLVSGSEITLELRDFPKE